METATRRTGGMSDLLLHDRPEEHATLTVLPAAVSFPSPRARSA
jgi:hypothetical protein